MRTYLPEIPVRTLSLEELNAREQLQSTSLSKIHFANAGRNDYINRLHTIFEDIPHYFLRETVGLWPHWAIAPIGRRLTINEARPLPQETEPPSQSEPSVPSREDGSLSRRLRQLNNIHPHTLYVGGIPYSASETALINYFLPFGKLQEVRIVFDKMTGRSKGFGFVRMTSNDEVIAAISALHDREFIPHEIYSPEPQYDKSAVIRVIETASKAFAELICREPVRLFELEWRDLERMLATVFAGLGFEVHLTPGTKDGGKDLILRFSVHGGQRSYYVEVKHWVSGKKVGNSPIREFLSVVARDKQDGGIFLSSSGFSAAAMEGITEFERTKLRLGNGQSIVTFCRTYLNIAGYLQHSVDPKSILLANTYQEISN